MAGATAMRIPGTAEAIGVVREWAALVMLADGCKYVDSAVLVISELVGNAIKHTRSQRDGGRVVVRLTYPAADVVRVDVIDDGATTVPRPRYPDWDMESGRGLWMVEQVALAWGQRALPGGRRAVWADVAVTFCAA
ncbi:ATP-binding protein [Spongiactinospora rosea]|uniref:ATP-binding protein n=1 Tax=Spongiactinospora rosea TaxID=2248750 RepID=A0A366LLS1_9ACTN|nr:ATP-binding protein [Spongiactinospora rosea]RBQ14379.1 ATP-binding protein [Spongiactinospora rosea]